MKTAFASACVAVLGILPVTAHAQDEYAQPEDTTPEAVYETPPVVYEAPVTYYAPVVYQSPVVYYAPVYYILPVPMVAYGPPPSESCAATSTVFVIGAHGGSYGYGHSGNDSSTITFFGQRGGWFGDRR